MMNLILKKSTQQGFALAMVLIILMVLALMVGGLLRSQTLALRETSDVFTSSLRAQESHNIHRECLVYWRTQMKKSNLEKEQELNWLDSVPISQKATQAAGVKNIEGTCQIFVGQTDKVKSTDVKLWTPNFRIVTKVNQRTEISEWRYPACQESTTCFMASTKIKIKNIVGDQEITVIPQFTSNDRVQTVWRIQ